jgi:hypothetical protein
MSEWVDHDGLTAPDFLGSVAWGRRRDGKTLRIPKRGWHYLLWSHLSPSPMDIIAYRVVKP